MAIKPDPSWRGEDDLTYRVDVWEAIIDNAIVNGQDEYDTSEGTINGQGYIDHFYSLKVTGNTLPRLTSLGWQLLADRYVAAGWNRLMHFGPDTSSLIKLVDREYVK